MREAIAPAWIRVGRAYPGWGWVLALACLWALFALLIAAIAAQPGGRGAGAPAQGALGYGVTAAAALFVALCAFIRRPWAQQLVMVSSAPMLLFFPVGTVVAAFAMRALFRNRGWFEVRRS